MKKQIHFLAFFIVTLTSFGQIVPGTLVVDGVLNFNQTATVQEAGQDDNLVGYESVVDTNALSFTLNGEGVFPTIDSRTKCMAPQNIVIKNYVFMQIKTTGAPLPNGLIVEAKVSNIGQQFPDPLLFSIDEGSLVGGDDYIEISKFSDGGPPTEVFYFTGCRENMGIQFRIKPPVFGIDASTPISFDITYTVVPDASL